MITLKINYKIEENSEFDEESDYDKFEFEKFPTHEQAINKLLFGAGLDYEDYQNERINITIWCDPQEACPNGYEW